ncbi:MAG: hypothetical protein ACYC5G_02220 [Candidatus Doudnabacteria bacterium]
MEDDQYEELIKQFEYNFISNQVPLDEFSRQVLEDNLWELYEN